MTTSDYATVAFWLGRHRGPAAPPPGRFLTVAECARHIGRSAKAVYHLVDAGQIPHMRQGRVIRFDRDKLDRWMEKHSRRGRMVA